MKKKFLIIFFIILGGLLLLCGTTKAATYSGDNYEITIPDNIYNVDAFADELEAESKDGQKYVGLTVVADDSNIIYEQDFLDYMVAGFKESFEDFKLISSKTIESNGCKGIEMAFRETVSNRYVYTDMYSFKSDNYSYRIYFMAYDRSYLTSTEKEQIFKSFKIKDTVVSSYGIPFTDVASNSWYYGAVKYVYNSDIIKGTNDYTFAPDKKLTRGMLVTILYRMDGSPKVSGTAKFPDVKSTDYYSTAIKWASDRNIVSGYNNGKFGPNDNITREQLAVILRKYAKYKGKNVSSLANISSYSDAGKVSSYAKTGVQWAIANGIISGRSNGTKIDPQGSTSRAEAAAMIYNYCLKIK